MFSLRLEIEASINLLNSTLSLTFNLTKTSFNDSLIFVASSLVIKSIKSLPFVPLYVLFLSIVPKINILSCLVESFPLSIWSTLLVWRPKLSVLKFKVTLPVLSNISFLNPKAALNADSWATISSVVLPFLSFLSISLRISANSGFKSVYALNKGIIEHLICWKSIIPKSSLKLSPK